MAYKLTKAGDPLRIAEQQYATASEIKFTVFTSCIGVIAKKDSSLTAVHLVACSDEASAFDLAAATGVLKLLPDKYDQAMIIGEIKVWQHPFNGVDGAFLKLQSGIKTLKKVQLRDSGSGTFGAKIKDKDIKLTYW